MLGLKLSGHLCQSEGFVTIFLCLFQFIIIITFTTKMPYKWTMIDTNHDETVKDEFLGFHVKYFAILDNAFNRLVAFLQHMLICSVKFSRLSMVTPRILTLTLFSELIDISSDNLRRIIHICAYMRYSASTS